MITRIQPRFIPRKDSEKNKIKIVSFLYDHPFSSLKQICKYDGNKNYKTTANYVLNLAENKIICKVPFWHGTAYYVDVDRDKTIQTLASYHTTKHRVSLRINKIAKQHPQLKEKFTKRGVRDFNKITKTNIPTKLFDVSSLDTSCKTIAKSLNLIILATRILILEEKLTKKNKLDKLHLVKRQARICEMWLDLESFLEKYFEKPEAEFMAIAKSFQLDYQMELYRKYYSHVTHSKTTFSEYLDLLRQIKFGYKQEYSQSKGMSLQCLSKILKKFTDRTGRIDIRYLAAMIQIETASSLKSHQEEIEDLFFIDLLSDEMSRTKIPFYKEDEIENPKTRKIIKEIYPQMR